MKKENFDTSKSDNSSTYIPYIQIYNNKIVKKDSLLPFILNGKQNQVLYGDILITISSENKDELGFSSIYLDDFCCYLNSFCFGIRLKNEFRNSIYQEYINIYFSSYNFRKKMFNISQGSTRYNLPKTDFLKFSILIPSINEQIKISKFFSLLDKNIKLWERKLQLYLLFFNYYHKYFFNLKITEMDCKINDYYCIPLKKAIDKNKYINYKKMILKLNNQGYELTNDSPIATEKGRSYFVREKNELLIGKQNIHNSSFYVLGDIGDKFVTSNALMSLISREDISTKYLYYFMKQKRWLYYVDSLNLSTGQKEYSEKQILNLPFKIINNHKRIVNFLEHIEKEISFIKTKISFLKNEKEFFLNNLFV